jgi:hypothetical protein
VAEQQLKDAQEDVADAKDDAERLAAEKQVTVAEAMIQAAGG